MTLVICKIIIAMNAGTFNIIGAEDVQGELLVEGPTQLLVDFSKDIKNFGISGKASDYSRKLVDKEDCVKQ